MDRHMLEQFRTRARKVTLPEDLALAEATLERRLLT